LEWWEKDPAMGRNQTSERIYQTRKTSGRYYPRLVPAGGCMKYYAAVMISELHNHPDTSTNWIEITPDQHEDIFRMIKMNKQNGAEERKL